MAISSRRFLTDLHGLFADETQPPPSLHEEPLLQAITRVQPDAAIDSCDFLAIPGPGRNQPQHVRTADSEEVTVSIASLRKFRSPSTTRSGHTVLLAACFTLIVLLGPFRSELKAQKLHPNEKQIKAAYLYNFGKFVTGSPTGSPHYQICILGKDPFGAVLDSTVTGEKIGGKSIRVIRLRSLHGVAPCNVLYISPSESERLASILQATQRRSVLTVSDIPRFAERGGTIGLINHEGEIRFEVNRASAQQKQLTLSSELLKVATRVIDQSAEVK